MKPYGQKRVGFGDDDKFGRALVKRCATRDVQNGVQQASMTASGDWDIDTDYDDGPFCQACGGTCTGLGAFVEDAGPRTMVKESEGR